MPRKNPLDFAAIRHQLAGRRNGDYWRSLNDLAETEEFRAYVEREFPEGASTWENEPSRRRFLQLMGASLALAGLQGCNGHPEEKIVPYVEMPEHIVPGKPLFFATAMPFAGFGVGLVVESHMGRPTKIEGNRLHPASLGATDHFAQASLLTLYDPDRSKAFRNRGRIRSGDAFTKDLESRLRELQANSGCGLCILTETVTSPTLAAQLSELAQRLPEMRWHQYEPANRDAEIEGARRAFTKAVQPVYHFDRADVVLSLGADFLAGGHWPVSYARHFMQRRVSDRSDNKRAMTRLYVAESSPSITGSKADHRWPLHPDELLQLARAVASKLGVELAAESSPPAGVPQAWVDHLVDDLQNYRRSGDAGAVLVVAGHEQPGELHALVHAMNNRLGAAGDTVTYREPVQAQATSQAASLQELVAAMQAGEVDTLLILHGNPVFTAPADLEFAGALRQVPLSVHLSLYEDETSALCDWHVPATHFLESWGDVRALDGTASIVQPLIAPLYGGWSEHELLSILLGRSGEGPYDVVQAYWREQLAGGDFGRDWESILQKGVIPGTESPPASVTLREDLFAARHADENRAQQDRASLSRTEIDSVRLGEDRAGPKPGAEFEILFRPDPTLWDGRFANNGWLQELPNPLTKLTWDNAALISPQAAEALSLENGDVVRIAVGERNLEMPAWILPGQAERCVTLHFGHGRRRAGRVGTRTGFDVFKLRTSDSLWSVAGVQLSPAGKQYALVSTQDHHSMEGRHPVEAGTVEDWNRDPAHPPFLHAEHHPDASLLGEWPYDSYKWGMAINLTACTGCNACVVACQAENNIPVVGKEEVGKGREMHWLRIDSYYKGELENPEIYHQPLPCMHCEKAPCELVCPVSATTHSDEGLNQMTYNRCIGTRYCSNNCPYKVRRFNFLQYADYDEPVLKLLRNPNVTVRSRGVMEKCTYCVQRINAARVTAETEDRSIRPGEVETACQAACPAQAISFGDLNNPEEEVTRRKDSPLNYSLLAELNTQPRTTFLAALSNPNPNIEASAK